MIFFKNKASKKAKNYKEIAKILDVSCYIEKVTHSTPVKNSTAVAEKYLLSKQKFKTILKTEKIKEFQHNKIQKTWNVLGSAGKPRKCITALPLRFCENCGQVYIITGNCNTPGCPDCSNRWRYQRTESIVKKLQSYSYEKKLRLQHIMISPSDKDYKYLKSPEIISKFQKNKIYPFLKHKNITGGVIIFHPFRIIKEKKVELYEYYDDIDIDLSLGEFALWKILGRIKNWRDFVYWSPHFHIIGITNRSEAATLNDRFVFKNIGDLQQITDVIKVTMYLLTHIGVHKNNTSHNIKYFGVVSNSKWSFEKATDQIRHYINVLLYKNLNDFADSEGVTHRRCVFCGSRLISMYFLDGYLDRFSKDHQKILKYCYKWCKGDVPPPKIEKMIKILSSKGNIESASPAQHGTNKLTKEKYYINMLNDNESNFEERFIDTGVRYTKSKDRYHLSKIKTNMGND